MEGRREVAPPAVKVVHDAADRGDEAVSGFDALAGLAVDVWMC